MVDTVAAGSNFNHTTTHPATLPTMKIIATGATGLIGRHALDAVLARPDVTSVIALVRRPLQDPLLTGNPKLHPVIVDDWLNYSDEVKKACEGAVGCVWWVVEATRVSTTVG
jgi:nucleoside-diphosphate-sugar epimerase